MSRPNNTNTVNGFHLITIRTLSGPWHVGTKDDIYWYIVNAETGQSKKIGPAQIKGPCYFDRAREEAERRNRSHV